MPTFNYAYDAIQLTDELMEYPTIWGLLGTKNLFPDEGVTSSFVEIGRNGEDILLLAADDKGSMGSHGEQQLDDSIIFKLPHFPHTETLKPGDLQDKFVFGSKRQQLKGVDTETAKRLSKIHKHHSLTLEFLRMGALKGDIRDGKGNVLANLFTRFGIPQKIFSFDLANPAADVLGTIDALNDYMEDNLLGETMSGVEVLVSREFMQKLISHPKVEKFFLQHQDATMLTGEWRNRFPLNGVVFEVYRGAASDQNKVTQRFIAADEGHAYPLDTSSTFSTYHGSPHHLDFVNTEGVPIFVSPNVLDHGKGVELLSQSNPLALCKRPKLLAKVTSAAP